MSFRPGQAKGANVRSVGGGGGSLPAWVNHTAFVHLESEYRAALLDPEIWYIVVGAELFLTSASNTYDVLTNESLGRKYVDGLALRSNGSIQWNSSDNSLLNFYHLAPINLNAPSGGAVTCLLGTPTTYPLGEVRFGHLGLVANANITTGTYTWNPNSNAQVVSYDSAASGVNIEPDLLSGDAKLKRESYVSTDYFANVQKKITLANNTFYFGGLAVEIYQDGAGNFEGEWTGLINITGKKPGAVTEIVSVTAIAMLKTDSTGTEASIEVLSDNSNGMITGIGFINNAVGFSIQEFNLVVQGVSGFEPTISGRTIGSTQNSKFIASSISTNAPFYSIALPIAPVAGDELFHIKDYDSFKNFLEFDQAVKTAVWEIDGVLTTTGINSIIVRGTDLTILSADLAGINFGASGSSLTLNAAVDTPKIHIYASEWRFENGTFPFTFALSNVQMFTRKISYQTGSGAPTITLGGASFIAYQEDLGGVLAASSYGPNQWWDDSEPSIAPIANVLSQVEDFPAVLGTSITMPGSAKIYGWRDFAPTNIQIDRMRIISPTGVGSSGSGITAYIASIIADSGGNFTVQILAKSAAFTINANGNIDLVFGSVVNLVQNQAYCLMLRVDKLGSGNLVALVPSTAITSSNYIIAGENGSGVDPAVGATLTLFSGTLAMLPWMRAYKG